MKREELNVNELIAYAKQGNLNAFEEILKIYEKKIEILVRKTMLESNYQPRYSDGIEDLIQIAKSVFSHSMYGYKETESDFYSYASICIVSALKNEFRRNRTQKGLINQNAYRLDNKIRDDEDMYYIDLVANNQPSFEGVYCIDERNPEVVLDIIKEDVGEECAEIYNLKSQGYKNYEISEKLQISEKRVSKGYNKVRKFYTGTLTKK